MTQQQINDLKQSLISLINLKLADQSTIIASEHREVETAIVDSIFTDKSLIGDIKEIACTQQYINDNFEPNSNTFEEGKAFSTSERVGWAICNGKNGTINKMGRVAIGYDPINYQLGSVAGSNTGGEKTVTLQEPQMPIHNHGYTGRDGRGWPRDSADTIGGSEGDSGWYRSYVRNTKIENKGGGQAHNNMQPYIVTLFIQKIS